MFLFVKHNFSGVIFQTKNKRQIVKITIDN